MSGKMFEVKSKYAVDDLFYRKIWRLGMRCNLRNRRRPINLVVLSYFFSMDMKQAAENSLYLILFSQLANLITAIATGSLRFIQDSLNFQCSLSHADVINAEFV